MKRIYSIDFTRGVVMIIMALDHVRDLMHAPSIGQSPTDLTTTTPGLFFTRWITYLCAPIFVFLAGTSAFLAAKRAADPSRAARFLLKRGLWLVALEFTVVNFGMFFDVGYHLLLFEVIAAIGFGFIILSLLKQILSAKSITLLGLAIIVFHGLLFTSPEQGSVGANIAAMFFNPGAIPLSKNLVFVMGYPPIPWLGIMLAGYGAGLLFEKEQAYRKRLFLRIGLACLTCFVLLRWANIYGDPVRWTAQRNAVYTFLSLMNITKYPPSLLFCLITLGIMFWMLCLGEAITNRLTKVANTYGKVPLFYFIFHFYLIHLILIIMLLLQGFHFSELNFTAGAFGRPVGRPSGVSLGIVYIIWVAVVAALYYPCRWYGRYKSAHPEHIWLRYL